MKPKVNHEASLAITSYTTHFIFGALYHGFLPAFSFILQPYWWQPSFERLNMAPWRSTGKRTNSLVTSGPRYHPFSLATAHACEKTSHTVRHIFECAVHPTAPPPRTCGPPPPRWPHSSVGWAPLRTCGPTPPRWPHSLISGMSAFEDLWTHPAEVASLISGMSAFEDLLLLEQPIPPPPSTV